MPRTLALSSLLFLTTGLTTGLSAADATWAEVSKVFQDHCINCHGEKKQKGGLRLDSPEWLSKGSKSGPVVVAGKPDESPVYALAALPGDHEDRMPPKGERVPVEQLSLIKAWILAGAPTSMATPNSKPTPDSKPAPDSKATKLAMEGKPDDMMAAAAPETKAADTKTAVKPKPEPTPEAPIIPAPGVPEFAVTGLTAQQYQITQLPGGWLDVNAAHAKSGLTDAHLPLLAKIGPAVAFLNLSGSGITDRQLKMLADFPNLQRLHLERTPVTDAGLAAVLPCQQVTYLNLFGTAITDTGLSSLRALKNLNEVYLWQTKTTPAGIAALKKSLPELQVIAGPDDLPVDKLTAKKKRK